MGFYKYLAETWKEGKYPELYRENLLNWRKEGAITKLEHPTRLDQARSVGYKAKQGFFVVRVKLPRGGRMRPQIRKGRRTKHFRRMKTLHMNYQWVAEGRAARKYHNCTVLNSYFLAKDGDYYWYEVILADPEIIKKYDEMKWILANQNKTQRGLTNAARRSRALLRKGKGHEKVRRSHPYK
ncbi:50S ribosomal protein L15e [Candidatus Woesearchaeota archaeon]|nr:50S ribosomal protein L15e [Candidatus Woesearchaeota archaeon]